MGNNYKAFLDMDGIKGVSQVTGYAGQTEIYSYSFGQPHTSNTTGSNGSGKVTFDTFHITKAVDATSTDLWVSCSTGKKIAKMTLNIIKKEGDKVVFKMSYTFTDVYVDAMSWAPGGLDTETASESITFKFKKSEVTIYQNDQPKQQPNAAAGWDVVQ